MPHKPGTIEALAQVVARTSKGVRPLRAVASQPIEAPRPAACKDAPTRQACIARIRFLKQAFGLGWMIEQATFNRSSLQALEDGEICSLLIEMERAREHAADGIPLEDGNFVRSIKGHMAPPQE